MRKIHRLIIGCLSLDVTFIAIHVKDKELIRCLTSVNELY